MHVAGWRERAWLVVLLWDVEHAGGWQYSVPLCRHVGHSRSQGVAGDWSWPKGARKLALLPRMLAVVVW